MIRAGVAQEDADTIRRAYDVWNESGPEALTEQFWAEDIVYREGPGWPDAGVYRGRAAALARMQALIDLLGPIEVRLDELIESSDGRFVACTSMVGEERPTRRTPSHLPSCTACATASSSKPTTTSIAPRPCRPSACPASPRWRTGLGAHPQASVGCSCGAPSSTCARLSRVRMRTRVRTSPRAAIAAPPRTRPGIPP